MTTTRLSDRLGLVEMAVDNREHVERILSMFRDGEVTLDLAANLLVGWLHVLAMMGANEGYAAGVCDGLMGGEA